MANKSVFASLAGRLMPKAAAQTAHGTRAYAYGAEHRLAQLAMKYGPPPAPFASPFNPGGPG